MNILVVGLGKLGLPMASVLSRRHKMTGYDVSETRCRELRNRSYVPWEPDCDYSAVNITMDLEKAVRTTDLAVICVNTPSLPDGTMDLSQVDAACSALTANVAAGPYPVVMASTVMPGTCAFIGNRHPTLQCISNPVWVALGATVYGLRHPPIMVVGGDDAQRVERMWRGIVDLERVPLIETDSRTAEFIKLAHNAWCCIKMAFIGGLGDDADALGIRVKDISEFFRLGGERSGQFWRYGPPFGGPCFPRDLEFFNLASAWAPLGVAASTLNMARYERIVDRICQGGVPGRVVIVGRSYKPGVPIDEASMSLVLRDMLVARGSTVALSDGSNMPKGDIYVVAHAELVSSVPVGAVVINLWEPPDGG